MSQSMLENEQMRNAAKFEARCADCFGRDLLVVNYGYRSS